MLQLLILADDFTGALDTGVQYAKKGYSTQMLMSEEPDFPKDGTVQVLVANTQSRHVPPEEAYRRVYKWAKAARDVGVHLLYKKTDSTFRGNVGTELEATLKAFGLETLIFAPAFPRLKRTVKNGVAFIDGVPLHETAFSRDPFNPILCSEIEGIVKASTTLPVLVAAPEELEHTLENGGGMQIIAVDAETDEDLSRIAFETARWSNMVVFAGCAGFAKHLDGLLKPPPTAREERTKAMTMLVVCGSVNVVSMQQVATAEADGVRSVQLAARQLLDEEYLSSPDGRFLIEEIAKDLKRNGCLILKTAGNEADVDKVVRYAKGLGVPLERLHMMISCQIGRIVSGVLKAQDVDVLTIFGGDTLYGIVRQIGCRVITPQKELFPGIVQSTLQMGETNKVIVSKAGGFGEDDLIRRLRAYYAME